MTEVNGETRQHTKGVRKGGGMKRRGRAEEEDKTRDETRGTRGGKKKTETTH